MSYAIQDRLYLDILFDNKALPFSQTFLLGYLHMSNGRRLKVPYLSLSVTDNQHWMVANGVLGDGVKITIKLRVGPDSSSQMQTYNFTMTYFAPSATEGATTYVIEGVLDAPRYLAGTSNKSVNGTSTAALAAIAESCGMTSDLVATNDTQVWQQYNRRFSDFAAYVAEHGYTKEDGCLQMAVDLQGRLLYRDITAMDRPKATFGLKDTVTPNVITVTSFRPVVSSGGGNVVTGYNSATVEQSLMKPDLYVKQESVSTVVNERGTLTVSATDKAKVKDGLVQYAPVDPGNVHDKFIRAQHQNRRVANLFASGLELVTPQPTNLAPLDTVDVSADVLRGDASSSTDASAYAGTYRVFDRIIYVIPGHYTEKFILARRTVGIPTANSVPTGATSHAPLQTNLVQPVSSLLAIPDFNFASLESQLTQFTGQASAALTATTSRLSSVISGAGTAMSDPVANITNKISVVIASMTSAKVAGVADILSHIAVKPPLGDPSYATWLATLALKVTSAKTNVTTELTDEYDNLGRAARRADALASVTKSVNLAAQSIAADSSTAGVTDQLDKAMNKLSKVINTAYAASIALAGISSLTSAKNNLQTNTNAATAPLNAQADELIADSLTWVAQTDAAKADLFAEIDAAAAS